ncbi:MAG: hypothetical protein GTO14_02875 [Anaerolineales bacterium]|nr:hypothetical protein [Anaerolineales bacterium]
MIKLLPWFFTLALLSSCAGNGGSVRPEPTQTLQPYLRRTMTPTVRELPPTLSTSPPLGPTPTPLVHVIQSGETLLWVAIRYGVELDDLLLANPGIDPELMSIGTELIIPSKGGQPVESLLPTPTPVALELSPVRCFATLSGGIWCITTISNPTQEDVEGVTSLVTLYDAEGTIIDRQVAYSPLNRVSSEQWIPVAVYFSTPPPTQITAVGRLLSAVPVSEADARYLDVDVVIDSSEADMGGLSWRSRGEIELAPQEAISPANVRLLLVALDASGEVVGFRVWEGKTTLDAGETLPFDVTVFSLDGPIIRVDLRAEALPSR